jgi:hypothetical protein
LPFIFSGFEDKAMRKTQPLFIVLWFVLASCDYGQLGGVDETKTVYPGEAQFENIMSAMSGVWYSHYAGIGRLDGYRIGRWEDFTAMVVDSGKLAIFPNAMPPHVTYTGLTPASGNSYFVMFDDSVYGQGDDSDPPGTGWGSAWCGIVRAVNVFNGDPGRGAVIVEYLKECAPQWEEDVKDGQRPFYGMYYRKLDPDLVQMASAVDLAAMDRGGKCYTETADLAGAIAKNTMENEAEFIVWSGVIPQNREP